jgi:FMN phosphatase YigB (HAD superfamily)
MLDLLIKRNFFFDLDDTLIDTENANNLGLKRAYQRLVHDCGENLSSKLPYEKFEQEMKDAYNADRNRYYDFDPEVFEKVCKDLPSKYHINPNCSGDSLSARLHWSFRQTKDHVIMPAEHALDLLSLLEANNECSLFLITKGRCHYQHTKMMLTNLDETLFDGLSVVKRDTGETKAGKITEWISKIESEVKKKVDLNQCVMIGDSPDDVAAGHTAGIHAVRIRTGAHRKEEPTKDEQKPDAEYENLGELLEVYKKGGFK